MKTRWHLFTVSPDGQKDRTWNTFLFLSRWSRHRGRKVFLFFYRELKTKAVTFYFSVCLSQWCHVEMPRLGQDLKEGSQKQASLKCHLNGPLSDSQVNIDSFNFSTKHSFGSLGQHSILHIVDTSSIWLTLKTKLSLYSHKKRFYVSIQVSDDLTFTFQRRKLNYRCLPSPPLASQINLNLNAVRLFRRKFFFFFLGFFGKGGYFTVSFSIFTLLFHSLWLDIDVDRALSRS